MTLNNLYKTEYKAAPPFIGLYKTDEKGNIDPIIPDYADEILETHGDKEVIEHKYSTIHHCLVVELKD